MYVGEADDGVTPALLPVLLVGVDVAPPLVGVVGLAFPAGVVGGASASGVDVGD